MTSSLKSQLLRLPLSIEDKVMLWLTVVGAKPACYLSVSPTVFNKDKRTLRVDPNKQVKMREFLEQIPIGFRTLDRYFPETKKVKINGKTYRVEVASFELAWLVSSNDSNVDRLYACFADLRGVYEPEICREIGYLLGYPKAAVDVYSDTMHQHLGLQTGFPPELEPGTQLLKRYAGTDWIHYVRYVTRKSHDNEDVQTAQRWARVIQTDLPELHAQFVDELDQADRF